MSVSPFLRWRIEEYLWGTWRQRHRRALAPLRRGSTELLVKCWAWCLTREGETLFLPRDQAETRFLSGDLVRWAGVSDLRVGERTLRVTDDAGYVAVCANV